MKGKIYVIEGTDGSGKKTQADMLYQYLKESGKNIIKQSFPNYDSLSAGPVKMYLGGELGENANDMDAYQASLLFATDRLCTYKKSLKTFYDNGGIIIFDRYVQSNMLHQAGKIQDVQKRDRFLNWLDNLEFNILKLPKPDKVIFLDVPPDISIKLARERADFKAGTKKDIHEQDNEHLISAYNAGKYLAKKDNWTVINCASKDKKIKSIKEIHKLIIKNLT